MQTLSKNKAWGWRGRVGLIMPATQTVTEPLFYAVAPKGISFHSSRFLFLPGGTGGDSMAKMETLVFRAVDELAQARVDCIAYLCVTTGLVRGLDGEKEFCKEIEEKTGIPVASALLSTVETLNLLKLRKIVITGPYPERLTEHEGKFFVKNGFEVLGAHGLGITDGFEFGQVAPQDIYTFSKRVWDTSADGLFIGCVAFNAMPIIERLEHELKVPVVTAHSAVLWKILRILGIKKPLRGFGKLLDECLQDSD